MESLENQKQYPILRGAAEIGELGVTVSPQSPEIGELGLAVSPQSPADSPSRSSQTSIRMGPGGRQWLSRDPSKQRTQSQLL